MLAAVLAAAAIVGRLEWRQALALGVIWESPLVGAIALTGAVAWGRWRQMRASRSASIAVWLRAMSGELRAGASLRMAFVASADAAPELRLDAATRAAQVGRPLEEVGLALSQTADLRPVSAVLRVASITGGAVVTVLEALSVEAADDHALGQERRSLTVAARWSIALVGGFPLVVLMVQLARGELGAMLSAGPIAAFLVFAGVGLLSMGIGSVALLMKRAMR